MNIKIDFDIRAIIIFSLLIIYFIVEVLRNKNRYSKKRLRLWIIVRIIFIICLFLVFTHSVGKLKCRDTSTIFLVDESLSMNKYKNQIEDYINNEIVNKSKKDKVAVVGFAKEPMIELPFTNEKKEVNLNAKINSNFTNIERAVEFSKDYFPDNNNKRVVLITDFNENVGNIKKMGDEIKKDNINLLIHKVKNHVENDIQLTNIVVPKVIRKNENIPVKIQLDSTGDYKGDLYLKVNEKNILKKNVTVKKGNNIFQYNLPVNSSGNLTIKAEINFKNDLNKLNNIKTVFRNIKDNSTVLVIGNVEDTKNINTLLDSIGVNRKNYISNEVPNNIDFLSNFDEIILVNTAYEELPNKFDENLEKAVQEFGSGLLVIGGNKSFALGGYEKTKLEKILPVQCKMKDNRKKANTGLVLLIDCSGSMDDKTGGIKKIELAKQAAMQSVNVLEDEDYLGVLAFSDTLEWIVPFDRVKDKSKLIKDIGKLKSKGGTLIIPGISESINTLEKANVKVKHMILLTDGQAEKDGYNKLVEKMKKLNITMSTVAVGNDADKEVLKYLANSSGGRKYITKDFTNVPKILTKETYLSTKKYLNDVEFIPVKCYNDNFFKYDALPKLNGYTGTGIKNGGKLVLKSNKGDPICAYWRYGLGNVMTWTSDLSGKWSSQWINWNGFKKCWSSIIDYLLKSKEGKNVDLQIERKGANVKLLIKNEKLSNDCNAEVVINDPKGNESKLPLKPILNHGFEGDFDLDKIGNYMISIHMKDKNKIINTINKKICMDYSPEYCINTEDNDDDISNIIFKCDGKLIDNKQNIFDELIINKNYSYINLEFILIPLALLLFLVDVAIRMKK
ncbi:VWA domain-containing protein [Haloimpatiens sp. FM7330]|uniref:VWA domain-containing protein n=1 Tax=Haloimpatiens sp. FM7330 TaxID=3298610 RepID=UPI0036380C36